MPGGTRRSGPGLADLAPPKSGDDFSVDELKQRLLVTQALEAARTVEEGVITDPREADVGSILGFGFAPFTGGTLSYIDGMGVEAFVALAKRLAEKHGARFRPNRLLHEMAAKGESFYGRFARRGEEAPLDLAPIKQTVRWSDFRFQPAEKRTIFLHLGAGNAWRSGTTSPSGARSMRSQCAMV